MDINVFDDSQNLVEQLAGTIQEYSQMSETVHIALSGGSTPKQLFTFLASAKIAEQINWRNLHFWWGDERCVASDHQESNYGQAVQLLFEHVDIPLENLHRIRGEEDPVSEANRYRAELKKHLSYKLGRPQFDWVLLGVGEDGHTASLFPKKTDYATDQGVIVAQHPITHQNRISLAAPVLRAAKCITYVVTGKSKAAIVRTILQSESGCEDLPAANIESTEGVTEWYLDRDAASLLDELV